MINMRTIYEQTVPSRATVRQWKAMMVLKQKNIKDARDTVSLMLSEIVICPESSPWSIFFFKFIYCNWRLITLQYCGGFGHTLTWISHGCTRVPPSSAPLPSPSGLSQSTSFECPALCIELALVIYFTSGNIHSTFF